MSRNDLPVIDLVAGARPNFIKLAPVDKALRAHGSLRPRIVHTGQHYDSGMSDVFFEELGIPEPDVHLEVGSGRHGEQTARILDRYEAHLIQDAPRAVVVFGDVNSTVACALAAVKLQIPVAHVEAGLRSLDRTMPEEINRIVTDSISDLLLVSEPSGLAHLKSAGVPDTQVHLVGNTMIDTLYGYLPTARTRTRSKELGFAPREYALLTMHRPSNVDHEPTLRRLVALFNDLSKKLPILFPVHPRTRGAMNRAGISLEAASGSKGIRCIPPQPYIDNLSLMSDAAVVLTDSGGMQEETSVLQVPCITLRENTERPITIDVGASRLVGDDDSLIREAFDDVLSGSWKAPSEIPLWDGRAGPRIANVLAEWLVPKTGTRVA